MSDQLEYMNSLTRWDNPPEWNGQWAKALGMACSIIVERDELVQHLRERVGYWQECHKTAIHDCFNAVEGHKRDMQDVAVLVMEMSRHFNTNTPIWIKATQWLASASRRELIDLQCAAKASLAEQVEADYHRDHEDNWRGDYSARQTEGDQL